MISKITSTKLNLALAQMNARVGDIPYNRDGILKRVEEAKAAHCHLLVFPELSVCGYPPEDLLFVPDVFAACEAALEDIRQQSRDICIIVGAPRHEAGLRYNSAFVFYQEEVRLIIDKQHLPNHAVFDEKRYFFAGGEQALLELALPQQSCRLGISICEDIWHPQGPHHRQAASGADILVNISASPFYLQKSRQREAMLQTRARDYGCHVLFCNQVGGQDELIFDGASSVIDGQGQVVARAASFQEDLIYYSLDSRPNGRLSAQQRFDLQTPTLTSITLNLSDKPPLPQPSQKAELPDKHESVYQAICLGLRDYFAKNEQGKAIIGLSGGVDSALVATLAADALGAEQVLAVMMPSCYSSHHSKADAKALAQNLGIKLISLPIEAQRQLAWEQLAPYLGPEDEQQLAAENLQARLRALFLMALSNAKGHLLLSTGNKSELAVGYSTLYGDMAGAYAPIKDLYKSQVYQLCDHLNSRQSRTPQRIPQSILDKAPSAELAPDQYDQQSLPDYAVLDGLLSLMLEHSQGKEQLLAAGFAPQLVDDILARVRRNEFKRRQAPPGPRLSRRAFGKDWRLTISNGFADYG